MTVVETRVGAVTVYADRALVTRRGEVTLSAGAHELVVDDLPLGLVDESVRAAARATVSARVGGTDMRWRVQREPVDELVAGLHRRLEELDQRDLALQHDTASLRARERFFESIGTTAGRQLARQVTRGQAALTLGTEIDEFLSGRAAVLRDADGELSRRGRELAKEREALTAELARVEERLPAQRRQVAVSVETDGEGRVELELRYQVGDASWRPVYDLRLDESEESATLGLTYQALVTQRTGEAWPGVALTLSTARPALGLTVPELDPWYIAPRPAPPAPVLLAGGPAPAGPMRSAKALAMEAPAPQSLAWSAPTVVAQVESASGAVTFRIPGDADIPSDGSPHRVTVGEWSFDSALDHVTAPRLATHAYRRVRTHNRSDAVLLPGPAQVIVGGEVVGSTKLDTTGPGQELEVFCGVDDRIHVERELVTGSVDKRTLRDNTVLTYAYVDKVTNLCPRAQSIVVRDAVPLSGHELVKVRDVTFAPRPASVDDLGRAEWEVRVEPQKTAEIRLGFVIEHPRDLAVIVPPRR